MAIPRASGPSRRSSRDRPQRGPAAQPDSACYTADELAFMRAVERYKHESRRPHPAWSEILAILISLGYRLVCPPVELPRYRRKGET